MFKTMTGIEMTHVPYKGSAPALTDVVGGHIALLLADPAPALPLIKAGKVRALGVTSAALFRRSRPLDIPRSDAANEPAAGDFARLYRQRIGTLGQGGQVCRPGRYRMIVI